MEREYDAMYEIKEKLSTCLSQYLSTCSQQQTEDGVFIIWENLCWRAAAQLLSSHRPHHLIVSCKNESFPHHRLEFNVNAFFTNLKNMTTPERDRVKQEKKNKKIKIKINRSSVVRSTPWDWIHQDSRLDAVMELWFLFFFLSPTWRVEVLKVGAGICWNTVFINHESREYAQVTLEILLQNL